MKLKKFCMFFALLAAILLPCSLSSARERAAYVSPDSYAVAQDQVEIKMLNVGQGDSILVRTAEQTVLIDTSDVDERDKLESELQKAGVEKLDKVILTHHHADHIGGMDVLFGDGYPIGAIYDNGMPSTSRLYRNYMKEAQADGIEHYALASGDVLDFGDGAVFEVLSPEAATVQAGQGRSYKHDPNNESVVGRLVYGNFTMLFTGDAERQTEASILRNYSADAVESNVLKSPHHGSSTSSTMPYLKAVRPDVCLISCGINNDYGHPHQETLQKYQQIGADVFVTAQNGTITVDTDGSEYTVTTEY